LCPSYGSSGSVLGIRRELRHGSNRSLSHETPKEQSKPAVTLQIDLSGRHAVITGGASGIGKAIAIALQDCGARVTVLDIDEAALKAATAGYGFASAMLDVTDGKAVRATAAAIDTADPVHIVIAAAGVLQRPSGTNRLTDAEWDRVTDTNLKGSYLTLARFGEHMAKRRQGSLLAIASVMGLCGTPLHAYGPAKAALINLVQGLAGEWAGSGLRVNALAPGFVHTPALALGLKYQVLDEERLAASAAQNRLVKLDEVTNAAAFLVSDLASGITGTTLPVDAGFLVAPGWSAFGGVPTEPAHGHTQA
jgi:NAD(P)-dependent dehydrogenase (short-subunit alcohol dehydrogenase family)